MSAERRKGREAKVLDEGLVFLKERVWCIEEGEETVYELVDELITRATNEGLERRLNILTYPYAVDKVLEDCMEILRWACITHDLGEVDLANDHSWKLDEEPAAVPIDSWARGAVPVKTAPPPATRDTPLSSSLQRKRLSLSTHSPHGTRALASQGGVQSSREDPIGEPPSTAGSSVKTREKLASIPPRPIRDSKLGKVSQPSTAASTSQPKEQPKEPQKPKTELKTKDASREKKDRPLETAIYVVSQTVNPEQLPPQFVAVKMEVRETDSDEPKKRGGAYKGSFAPPPKKRNPNAAAALAAAKKGPPVEIHRSIPVESMPSTGVGTIALLSGVSLKEPSGVRYGPSKENDPNHLSRKEYVNTFASKVSRFTL